MLTVSIEGLDELEAAWGNECTTLTRAMAETVDAAAKQGRSVAQSLVPRRTGKLDSSIEGYVTSRSSLAAEGVLEANASYASYVAHGTRPHAIRARRSGVLRFMVGDSPVFRRSVRHPGTAANEFWERAVYEARQVLEARTLADANSFARRLSS